MIRSSSLDAPSPPLISRASLSADSSCSNSYGRAPLKSRAGTAGTSFARSSLYAKCSSYQSTCSFVKASLSFAKLAQFTNAIRLDPTSSRTNAQKVAHLRTVCSRRYFQSFLGGPVGTALRMFSGLSGMVLSRGRPRERLGCLGRFMFGLRKLCNSLLGVTETRSNRFHPSEEVFGLRQ